MFYELLFSRVLIITDRKFAREILAMVPEDVMFVTLIGEVFFNNGKIIGGKNNTNAHISRPRQMQDLRELGKMTPQLENINDLISEKQRDHEILLNTLRTKQMKSGIRN